MVQSAAPQVRTAQSIINRQILRNGSDSLCPIHENPITAEQRLCLIDIDHDLTQKFAALLNPPLRQITRQPANASVTRREPRPGQRFAKIIDLLTLGER